MGKQRILFLIPPNDYLFRRLFEQIMNDALQRGHEIGVLKSTRAKWKEEDLAQFAGVRHTYGKALAESEGKPAGSRIGYHLGIIRAIREMKREVAKSLADFSPDLVLTPDSYDPILQVIHRSHPQLPLYYLQHSNIVSAHVGANRRSRLQNRLTGFLTGIRLNDTINTPPFGSKNLQYLMWAPRWTDNVVPGQYRIKQVPRILSEERIPFTGMKNEVPRLLVILNKRSFIGEKGWLVFAEFYKNAFAGSEYEVVFKAHPNDDIGFARSALSGFEVISGDIDLEEFDAVVGHWSTFVYEATLRGKAYLMANPGGKFDFRKFRLDDYPLMLNEAGDFETLFGKIRNKEIDVEELNRQFLTGHLGEGFGTSSDHLFQTILSGNE